MELHDGGCNMRVIRMRVEDRVVFARWKPLALGAVVGENRDTRNPHRGREMHGAAVVSQEQAGVAHDCGGEPRRGLPAQRHAGWTPERGKRPRALFVLLRSHKYQPNSL